MGLKVYATSATEAKDKAIVACGLQSATKYLWDSEHYRARHCLGNTYVRELVRSLFVWSGSTGGVPFTSYRIAHWLKRSLLFLHSPILSAAAPQLSGGYKKCRRHSRKANSAKRDMTFTLNWDM